MAIWQARLEMIRSLTVHCPLSACRVPVTVAGHHCLHVLVLETGVCQGRCNSLASHVCSNRAGPSTPLLWYAIPSHGVGVGLLTQPNHDHTTPTQTCLQPHPPTATARPTYRDSPTSLSAVSQTCSPTDNKTHNDIYL